MALTHDGLQTPLPPSRPWQLIGLLSVVGGIAAAVQGYWCASSAVIVFGLLALGDQLGGVTRVRVTFSKLLVEDERPVRGFLIGPKKRRIPWGELATVEVKDGAVVASGGDTVLRLGAGVATPELEELARKIREAAQRFAEEGADATGRDD